MAWQRFTSIVAAAGLILCLPVTLPVDALCDADTNGDRAVDILDLQQTVAALLSPTSDNAIADVNGDGVVDILDVQRILSAAAETSAPGEESPPPALPPGVPAPAGAQPHAPVPAMALLRVALLPPSLPSLPLPAETAESPPCASLRVTCVLAAHAPPLSGAESLPGSAPISSQGAARAEA